MAQANSASNSAPSSLSALRARADYAEQVKEVTNRIHAAHDLSMNSLFHSALRSSACLLQNV